MCACVCLCVWLCLFVMYTIVDHVCYACYVCAFDCVILYYVWLYIIPACSY